MIHFRGQTIWSKLSAWYCCALMLKKTVFFFDLLSECRNRRRIPSSYAPYFLKIFHIFSHHSLLWSFTGFFCIIMMMLLCCTLMAMMMMMMVIMMMTILGLVFGYILCRLLPRLPCQPAPFFLTRCVRLLCVCSFSAVLLTLHFFSNACFVHVPFWRQEFCSWPNRCLFLAKKSEKRQARIGKKSKKKKKNSCWGSLGDG